MNDQIIIGITGSFGSGCSTVTEVLRDDYDFTRYSLSETLSEEWGLAGKEKPIEDALRWEKQDFGNYLRAKSLPYLADKTLQKIQRDGKQNENLVIDSIRNTAEIAFFRSAFPNFQVIAVDCAEGDRWERVRKDYEEKGKTYADFRREDERDKNEEGKINGQQVALCVFEADYLIRNDNDAMITTETAFKRRLKDKLDDPIKLFRVPFRRPNSTEAFMGIAYDASLMSACIKRQVGAVIIDKNGGVVSIGYNKNPQPLKPCYEQFGDCYREIYAENVMGALKSCPFCRKPLNGLLYPYDCPHCHRNIYKEIVRDRALSRCTALHAEEKAIIDARSADLNDCTLYVTTFPCFNCAQKILEVGIKTVYYVESYPDIDAVKLIDSVKKRGYPISMQKFEGVKARAYFKIFDNWRRKKEDLFRKRQKMTT